VNFGGTIANFKTGDFLDLRDITFGSSTSMSFVEAGNNLSGTLTVTDGSHTANITLLGNYSPTQFSSASDGHSGTVITDPPASAPTLWTSTPDANALLWQQSTSESQTGSGLGLRGGGAGPWLGVDPTHLLWQPANSAGGVATDFMRNGSAGTLGWAMHQPSLGG
jgi:hypothetical protein